MITGIGLFDCIFCIAFMCELVCFRCLQPLDPDESFVCPPSNIEGAEGDHASPQAYCKPCGLESIVDVQALVFAKFEVPDLE